jgi:anaerobic selenocysteine-containing dehydrogenase
MTTTQKKTFCRICEAHCGLTVDINPQGQLTKLRPDADHPISEGFVCAKGLRFLDVADHVDRLSGPRLRQADGTLKPASWAQAYKVTGDRLRQIIDAHGPHAVAVYFGTPMIHHSLLMLTLFQWLRALGTRNLYSAASQDNANKLAAQKLIHGREWRMPIMDIEHADFVLLLGTNPLVSQGTFVHAPAGTRAYDAVLKRGGRIVVVDPRETESAKRWGDHIAIKPGTDVFLLLAILHGLQDQHQPDDPPGMTELLTLAAQYPAQRAAALTGIPVERIHDLVHQFRTVKRATLFNGVGVNQGPFGMVSVITMQAIAYLSGNFDRQGGLLFQPWADMLQILVGLRPQTSRIGDFMSHAGGLPCGILPDEILTQGDGQIRALIVVGGNPLTSAPDENRLREAFQHLDLLVSIDLFENQTGELADVILPGVTWLERFDIGAWDAMYETAPMLQTAAPLRDPVGNARPEGRIIAELSIAAGKSIFGNRLLAWIWARVNWDRLLPVVLKPIQWLFRRRLQGAEGFPWPAPRPGVYAGQARRRLRFWGDELRGEDQRLADFATRLATEQPDDTFILMGRRRRLAQNSWIHNAGRQVKPKEACAWLTPDDMHRLGLDDGDRITIRSSAGEIVIPVMSHDAIMPGTVIVPHGLPDVNVNRLIPNDQRMIEPASGMHQMVGHPVHIHKAGA